MSLRHFILHIERSNPLLWTVTLGFAPWLLAPLAYGKWGVAAAIVFMSISIAELGFLILLSFGFFKDFPSLKIAFAPGTGLIVQSGLLYLAVRFDIHRGVIEHLSGEQATGLLSLFGRLLAPGGQVLVTTPNYGGFWPVVKWAMDRLCLAPQMKDEQHVTRFRLRTLKARADAAGLAVEQAGRFCGLAPFASVLGWRLAEWLDRAEWRLGQPLGNLLYLRAGRAR